MGLFDKQIARLPDNYPWTRPYKQAMWDGFWNAAKFSFDSDVQAFEMVMAPQERQMTLRALAAIAQIEVQVKTFWGRLGDHLTHPSIAGLGTVMGGVEEIHNDAYEKLILCLGREDIFETLLEIPAIKGRIDYLTKHSKHIYGEDERKQFVYSLILFTMFVEYVSLFSQFYIILRLNRKNKEVLKDAAQQVKYTRNEETIHAQIGMKIVNTLREEYPDLFDAELEERVRSEALEAFKAESNLIDWMLEGYEGDDMLSPAILKEFVKKRLNEALAGINYLPVFELDQELAAKSFWIEEGVYAPSKVDFFSSEPTSYVQEDASGDDDF